MPPVSAASITRLHQHLSAFSGPPPRKCTRFFLAKTGGQVYGEKHSDTARISSWKTFAAHLCFGSRRAATQPDHRIGPAKAITTQQACRKGTCRRDCPGQQRKEWTSPPGRFFLPLRRVRRKAQGRSGSFLPAPIRGPRDALAMRNPAQTGISGFFPH